VFTKFKIIYGSFREHTWQNIPGKRRDWQVINETGPPVGKYTYRTCLTGPQSSVSANSRWQQCQDQTKHLNGS